MKNKIVTLILLTVGIILIGCSNNSKEENKKELNETEIKYACVYGYKIDDKGKLAVDMSRGHFEMVETKDDFTYDNFIEDEKRKIYYLSDDFKALFLDIDSYKQGNIDLTAEIDTKEIQEYIDFFSDNGSATFLVDFFTDEAGKIESMQYHYMP